MSWQECQILGWRQVYLEVGLYGLLDVTRKLSMKMRYMSSRFFRDALEEGLAL